MDASLVFMAGLVATVLIAGTIVGYLRPPLRQMLVEQNGGNRVKFWAAYFNVVVMLVSLMFAMLSQPEAGGRTPAALAVLGQVRWGLLGLVLSLLVAGRILRRKVPSSPAIPTAAPTHSAR